MAGCIGCCVSESTEMPQIELVPLAVVSEGRKVDLRSDRWLLMAARIFSAISSGMKGFEMKSDAPSFIASSATEARALNDS